EGEKRGSESLTGDGDDVAVAGSGAESLEAATQASPDLVLLDIRMRGMDGFEIFRRLRAQGYRGPILFLSGLNEDVVIGEGLRLGAEYYITKPFLPQLLLRVVEDAIRGELKLDLELPDHPEGATGFPIERDSGSTF